MDAVVDLINKIGNIGGIMGLGWAAWGAWDFFIGFRRDLDEKKDKGLQSILLGAIIGGVIKTLFAAIATGLQSLG